MKGTAIWTALPNGYTDDGRPKLSVLVAPRFDDLTVADPLGPFADWPTAIGLGKLTLTVRVDGGASFPGLVPLYFKERRWSDPKWVSQASAMWKAAFRNYLPDQPVPASRAVTALGRGYDRKIYTGILHSSYQNRVLGDFVRGLLARQNRAVSLVKRPNQLGALAETSRAFTATTKLVADLNMRLRVNATEQEKLETLAALKRFQDWVPNPVNLRAAAAALKAEALGSLSSYTSAADESKVGMDLQPWVLDAAIISIARQLGVTPPPSGRGLLAAASRGRDLGAPSVPHFELAEFAKFHAKEQKDQNRNSTCPSPVVEIHSAFSMLGDFPQLERALGIVLDLELPGGSTLPATGLLSVEPQWSAAPNGMVECSMKTQFTVNSAQKRFFVTPATPYLDQGFVALGNAAFHLETLDIDSSTYAAVYGTGSTPNEGVPSTDQPIVSPPATAGISVVFTGKENFMKTLVDRATANDDAVAAAIASAFASGATSCSGAVLSAEDVFLGVRLDAKSQSNQTAAGSGWTSICFRTEQYRFPKSGVPDWSPDGQVEGEVRLGGDQSDTTDPDTKVLRTAPAIARWEPHGWGFATIPQQPLAKSQDPDAIRCEVPEESRPLAVGHVFSIPQGSLPRLPQFGESYKIRLRFVDIAGNSTPAADDDGTHAIGGRETEYLPYKRFEPIPPPFPLLWSALGLKNCPARQLTTLVVSADDAFDRRFIAPPRVQAYTLAKAHEKLLGRKVKAEDPGAFPGAQLDQNGTFFSLKETGADGKDVENPIFLYQPANAEPPEDPYWGDPAAFCALAVLTDRRHFAFLRDANARVMLQEVQAEIGLYYRNAQEWPRSQPFVLELHRLELPGPDETPPTAALSQFTVNPPFANAVRVDLRPGEKVLLKLTSRIDTGTPNETWTNAMALFDPTVDDIAQASGGELPAIAAPLEITLIHAVKRPVNVDLVSVGPLGTVPCLTNQHVLVRDAGAKSVSLTWTFHIHRPSVGRLDLKASWTEMTEANGTECHVEQHSLVLEHHRVDLDPTPLRSTPAQIWDLKESEIVENVIQDFGDTHYRLVTYSAHALTRYREYFSAGGNEKDYSCESNSVTVSILSTQRPDPPSIHSAAHVFEWSSSPEGDEPSVLTRKGVLRIYLDPGWPSSGDGEQLAAVLIDPAIGATAISDDDLKKLLTPVTTRWGMDPLWETDPLPSFPAQSDFRDGIKPGCSYTLPGLENSRYRFKIVAVSPVYDKERKLWRAEFSIDPHKSYMPFIRLALARYQANSIDQCELSPVVLAEFAQLLPDRTMSLSYVAGDDRRVTVTVQGVSYQSRSGAGGRKITEPTRFRAALEERAGDLSGDLGWHRVDLPSTEAGGWLTPDHGYPMLVPDVPHSTMSHLEWRFSVSLPESRKRRRYRVVIKEDEVYQQEDHSNWPDFSATSDFSRTVFMSVLGV